MVHPEKRLDDAKRELQLHSALEQRALMEELQNWYFGSFGTCTGGSQDATDAAQAASYVVGSNAQDGGAVSAY